MKIKMLRTANGSEDGFTVKAYLSGEEYEVGEALAAAFVDDMKVATLVDAKAEAAPEKAPEKTPAKTKAKNDDPAKD